MNTSVVIATYNRPYDLSLCVDTVLAQTMRPMEIIVVDNGRDTASEMLVQQREVEFAGQGISLRYVRNHRNSLTAARNLGSGLARGDIVFFLDDDTTLDADYIAEILRVYETTPNALGVQGYIRIEQNRRLRNLVCRLFFLSHLVRDRCTLMPSIGTTYPRDLDGVLACERLSGVSSYRRRVVEELRFDERLVKYADGEDVDFSYRVSHRYPNSLFITPLAKYANTESDEGRASGREPVHMREVYSLYLFFKLFDGTLKNWFIYLWGRVGWAALSLVRPLARGRPFEIFGEMWYLLGAYYLCLRHWKEIRTGDLEFFNMTLV